MSVMLTETSWGANFVVEVSSASPDADPVWNDITPWVVVPEGSTLETWLGRATELTKSGEPGHFQLLLLNRDDRFTPGSPSSPYNPWWKQARRFRIREVIGYRGFVLAHGHLEIPDNVVRTQEVGATDSDILMVATGIDMIGRRQSGSGRKFLSALAEHIKYSGGSTLKGYWPMTQAAIPFAGYGPTTAALNVHLARTGTGGNFVAVQPQTGLAPTGSEFAAARMPSDPAGPGHAFLLTDLPSSFTPSAAASDAIVLAFWFAFAPSMSSNDAAYRQIASFVGPSTALSLEMSSSSRNWNLLATGTMTGTIATGPVGDQQLLPIGIYLKESTSTLELWIGSVRLTTTLAGSPLGAGTFSSCSFGYQNDYDLSHVQVYVGADWGYTQYLEQIRQANDPLNRQLTGDRIKTTARYAGIPLSALDGVDPGTNIMGPAALAGKAVAELWQDAVDTEQGRLFAQDGLLIFHDRRRVLDI